MNNFQNLILAESLHSKLICNADECLSYILVLLNMLTIFYLVYSSYKKVSKITRIFGYFWSSLIMCGTVVVLFLHTCIFTIMCAVFTAMAIISVLSMIFESKEEEKLAMMKLDFSDMIKDIVEEKDFYIIYKVEDNKYSFVLKRDNKIILKSIYKYDTVEDARNAILGCKEYNMIQTESKEVTPAPVEEVEEEKVEVVDVKADDEIKDEVVEEPQDEVVAESNTELACVSDEDEESDSDDESDEENESNESETADIKVNDSDVVVEFDEETQTYNYFRYKKSHYARVCLLGSDIKGYYSEIKNYLLSYGLRLSKTKSSEKFYLKKELMAQIKISKNEKNIYLYLAIDPSTLEGTKYKGKDMTEKKAYSSVPYLFKIRTERKCKWAKELVDTMGESKSLLQKGVENIDYTKEYPERTIDELLEANEIKKVQIKAPLNEILKPKSTNQ